MGNNEAKFEKVFEEIDTSGDGISPEELADYIDPIKNDKAKEVLDREFPILGDQIELNMVIRDSIGKNDQNRDGKLSFEEFKEALKDNENMKKFILKMAKD